MPSNPTRQHEDAYGCTLAEDGEPCACEAPGAKCAYSYPLSWHTQAQSEALSAEYEALRQRAAADLG